MTLPSHAAVQQFWPTSFYAFKWRSHAAEAAAIIQFLYGLRDQQQTNIDSGIAPAAKSSRGLYESHFDLLDEKQSGIQKLRAFITESVQQAVADVNGNQVQPHALNVEIRDSWYHITNAGGFHDAHFHSHCSWCGIYYVQIGESGKRDGGGAPNGTNRFYSPKWSGGRTEDYGNQYLGNVYLDPPISDGMLLLFPSYLMHSALPYSGDRDRIVISFNSCTTVKPA